MASRDRKSLIAWLRPRWTLPKAFPASAGDKLAFWVGTGLGSGLLRPAPATWGSLAGLGYLFAWAHLPGVAARVAVEGLALWFSVWCATRCERLFQQKDPGSVVIDEIVVMPLAFWPLLQGRAYPWPVWVGAFCLYRLADIVKPFPARQAEKLRSGWGIVADDVVSALYTGLILLGWPSSG